MEDLQKDTIIKERYRLRCKLGEGSFGEVWLADDTLLEGLPVALKFYQRTDTDGQAAFTREYTRVQHLKHDNLLTATYFDFYQRRPFLVMDYCADGAVSKYRGHMEEKQVWKFVHDVAAGLAYMHRQNPPIIHQDIKPGNVLVHSSGKFVVTDFGISRSALSGSGSGEALKSAGTIAYMGPERFKANAETIMASDVWSLGSSLYELITGNVPFQGGGGVMLTAGAEMPSLPSRYSKEINAVMQACLAKDTWDRPRAAQLVEYTEAIMRGERPTPPWSSKSYDGKAIGITNYILQCKEWAMSNVGRKGLSIIAASLVVAAVLAVLLATGRLAGSHREMANDDKGIFPKETVETVTTSDGVWTGGKDATGKPDGEGRLDYSTNDPDGRLSYSGEMLHGKRHGKGTLIYRNGSSFEGEFLYDNLSEGVFKNVDDGLYFSGTFSDNMPHSGEWRYIGTDELYEKIGK